MQKNADPATKKRQLPGDAPLLTVCQLGRMGDIVAAEPAYRFLHRQYPERKFRWYTRPQYLELLKFAPFLDETVPVASLEEYLNLKAQLPGGTVSYEFNVQKHGIRKRTEKPFPSLLRQFSEEAGLDMFRTRRPASISIQRVPLPPFLPDIWSFIALHVGKAASGRKKTGDVSPNFSFPPEDAWSKSGWNRF